MQPRITATIVICTIAAGVAVVGLARPATTTETAAVAADAPATTVAGYGAAPDDSTPDGAGSDDAAAAPAEQVEVVIEGFAFDVPGTIAPGSTITVTNRDGAPHTLTATDGAFDTGTIDGGAATALTLPTEPGTYSIFCEIHPSMTATVTVGA
ncbi:MAG: cupredoxin domain-containing protein [Actinomycetota bacterium]